MSRFSSVFNSRQLFKNTGTITFDSTEAQRSHRCFGSGSLVVILHDRASRRHVATIQNQRLWISNEDVSLVVKLSSIQNVAKFARSVSDLLSYRPCSKYSAATGLATRVVSFHTHSTGI